MRNYGVVSPRFWIGETGKSLRGNASAQVLALYLMTCPHANAIGVFHCPMVYMMHETGLDSEGASKALRCLIDGGFCSYEDASETVFVHRMAAFQVGEQIKPGDKRASWIIGEWRNIASASMRAAFYAIYSVAFGLPKEPKKHSPLEAPSKPHRSQEQEQEQEQENTSCSSAMSDAPDRFDRFWSAYPRKVGKVKARKIFERQNPDDALLAVMLSAIVLQAKSAQWQRDGGQYIPHPTTWLNEGRWQDETGPDGAEKTCPAWAQAAGFRTAWDAENAGCTERTAHLFQDGARIAEVAA